MSQRTFEGTHAQEAEPVVVNAPAGSQEMTFSFDLGDSDEVHRQNKNLEVRLYNADGVPAERVLIPFREVPWGNA